MLDKDLLTGYLEKLNLGRWQFFKEIGSTNDVALQWAKEGVPDWSLVIGDTQKQGRGRQGRRWITHPGSALALSLILRPTEAEAAYFTRFTALGALGLVHALKKMGLQPEIKWPNDVLLGGRKAAGILVEGDWQGVHPLALVVGIGVNITENAVPDDDMVRFPATSVELIYGSPVERWEILVEIVRAMQNLRLILCSNAVIDEWNQYLAFRGVWITFKQDGKPADQMKVEGVTTNGALSLIRRNGERIEALAGEIVFD